MEAFVVSKSMSGSDTLEKLIEADPGTIGQILEYGLVVAGSLKLPKACQHKEVLQGVLNRRLVEVGQAQIWRIELAAAGLQRPGSLRDRPPQPDCSGGEAGSGCTDNGRICLGAELE